MEAMSVFTVVYSKKNVNIGNKGIEDQGNFLFLHEKSTQKFLFSSFFFWKKKELCMISRYEKLFGRDMRRKSCLWNMRKEFLKQYTFQVISKKLHQELTGREKNKQ